MINTTQKYHILFILVLLCFAVSKMTHLDVPYFWDESWVYAPAVNVMADLGPTMYAGSFPLEHSRGHPLFFHFLGGSWVTIFGNSLVSLHAFALMLSIAFISSIYIFVGRIISVEVALASCILLIFQPLFYAQSSIVLPEMLLSFLCFLSLVFLYQKKWVAYFLAASLSIWTKESAIAFVLCLGGAHFLAMLIDRKFSIKELLLCLLPLISFILFIALNKIAFDFYLYPEHTGMLTFESSAILGKLKAIFINILYDQKRWPLTIAALASLMYLAVQKNLILKNSLLIYLVIPIIGFAIFSSLNFYTVRYVLAIFPLVIIIISWFIVTVLKQKPVLLWILIFAFTTHSIIQLFDRRSISDTNLSYLDYGPAQLEVIKYFEENNLYQSPIHTGFLTSTGLTNKDAGYRSTETSFTEVNQEMNDNQNYFIFSSVEPHYLKEKVLAHPNKIKLKDIRKGNVFFEIYLIDGKL